MKKDLAIRGILFDLDDTLINCKKAEYNAISEFKNTYHEFKTIDNKKFARLWNKIAIENYDKYHKGEISFEKLKMERMKRLFASYMIKISDEEAKEKFKRYQLLYEKNWILFDEVIYVLERLKNKYKLVIVSNGDGHQQRKKIEYTGLQKYFSEIIISSEVGASKPDKEIFKIACKKISIKPENCIMVGDKYKVDIEGSINMGMRGIWVNRKRETSNYKYMINELSELFKYL